MRRCRTAPVANPGEVTCFPDRPGLTMTQRVSTLKDEVSLSLDVGRRVRLGRNGASKRANARSGDSSAEGAGSRSGRSRSTPRQHQRNDHRSQRGGGRGRAGAVDRRSVIQPGSAVRQLRSILIRANSSRPIPTHDPGHGNGERNAKTNVSESIR
jgi:hypothetical protein